MAQMRCGRLHATTPLMEFMTEEKSTSVPRSPTSKTLTTLETSRNCSN